jgi:hypothetical protein
MLVILGNYPDHASKSPLEIACEILSREARALPIAVEPAIHGFHFEKILERVCRPSNY